MNPGGKGANQAVAVSRLSRTGGSCVFIGKVGDDLFAALHTLFLFSEPRLKCPPSSQTVSLQTLMFFPGGEEKFSMGCGAAPSSIAAAREKIITTLFMSDPFFQ